MSFRATTLSARLARPLILGLAGALLAAIYFHGGFSAAFAVISLVTAGLVAIALVDLEHQLVPNRIVAPLTLALLALAPFWPALGVDRGFLGLSGDSGSLVNSLAGGAGAFLFFLVINLVHGSGMGEGDVKLAAVIGLFLGLPMAFLAIWLASAAAGFTALVALGFRKMGRHDKMPFGPFLVGGAMAAVLLSILVA